MVLPVNYGSCENLVRATTHDCAVLEYIFQDFVCVRFAFIMMNSMRRMEKKGCFCARKKERKKHHHFSSLKANKFNAAEILNSTVFDAESGRSRFGTYSEEYIFASSPFKREKLVCENNRMIQLILFYCIRHAMTHKYQIFSATSLMPHCAFAFAIVGYTIMSFL